MFLLLQVFAFEEDDTQRCALMRDKMKQQFKGHWVCVIGTNLDWGVTSTISLDLSFAGRNFVLFQVTCS